MNNDKEGTHSAFDNLNKLNDMILDKAHSILKKDIEESKALILKNIQSEKPSHLTDEEWENYKKVGERLLNI
jgi:hypothetical protein